MEKEKLKSPYESAEVMILSFGAHDIITDSPGYGTEGDDDQGWT